MKSSLVPIFAFLAAVPLAAQEAVSIGVPALNVRNGPSPDHALIGKVYSEQIYVAVATSGNWRKIWYGQGTGWVYTPYLSPTNAPMAQVTASLNVRTGPGTGYDVVGTAPAGSWWSISGSSGAWRKIHFKGAVRWVHGAYLSTGGPVAPPVSSVGFIQLPASGTGFYSYSPPGDRWGAPAMIYGLMHAAASWDDQHDWPRLGIGDISLKNGGPMPGHVSHKVGKDADLFPVRKSGEGSTVVGSSTYSQTRTKDLITHHLKQNLNVKVIFFNDSSIYNSLSYVDYWPNHYNHMHVRIW